MIIDLANIGATPKKIDLELESSELDVDVGYATITGKASFCGEAVRTGSRAHVRGKVRADVSLDCARCLEPITKHIDVLFDDTFVDASETRAAETEIDIDELDESLVPEGKIDVTEVIREQVLLALPEQIFCREDCKGLCPKCGANRNLIDCKCADDEVDPRWAALKNLK